MTVDTKDSILQSTKKFLGIDSSYDVFDMDVLLHINSVFSTLYQLGVGLTDEQFEVEDENTTWAQALGTQKNLVMIKSYVYLRVRLLFDPPQTGFATTSMDNQIKELEWRITVAASSSPNLPVVLPPVGTIDDIVEAEVEEYLEAHPPSDTVVDGHFNTSLENGMA
jgi:hypothetical protein